MTPDEKKVMQQSQRYTKWLSQKIFHSVAKTNQRTWTVKRGERLLRNTTTEHNSNEQFLFMERTF